MDIENIKTLDSVEFHSKGEKINLELTDEFKAGLEILEKTNQSIFITGKAGCGKSTLLNYFVSQTDKNVVVLAFTGLAAINVGGETMHSFFGFPLGFIDLVRIKKNKNFKDKIRNVDVIVIDEISMVRADMIDAMDKALRIHKDDNKPFGGVQVIFMGDLHQLPPIIGNDINKIYFDQYSTPFFFSANVFMSYSMPYLNLEKIFRQKDQKFIDVLNSVRERDVNLYPSLEIINENVLKDKKKLAKEMVNGETICITTTNYKSKNINDYFLNRLTCDFYHFNAKITGDFSEKLYPTDNSLKLGVGCKVMLIRNEKEIGYVNGDIGIITEIDNSKIVVKIRGRKVFIKKATWENVKYEYNSNSISIEKKVLGSFEQYPLKLAWSITIHKSQGQSYNRVFIDFGKGTFTSGQAYVALSRCRSLDGLMLNQPISVVDVKLDESIQTFYNMFDNVMKL